MSSVCSVVIVENLYLYFYNLQDGVSVCAFVLIIG